MSRSNPLRSSIAARLRQSSPSGHSRAPIRPLKRRINIRLAKLMRWLHIYLSMFGLAAVLFFSVTGLTLNHPDWFPVAEERRTESEGNVRTEWLHRAGASAGSEPREGLDPSAQIAKLEIVEYLRAAHAIHGALAEFRVDDQDCLVAFKGPAYSADAIIDLTSGSYRITQTYHGMVALLNDLHKGRDSGPVWSVVIDISAVLMTIISLTGLVLLFYLKLRRISGVVVALAGAVVVVALYRLWVPR
jgi:uncharacterized protein